MSLYPPPSIRSRVRKDDVFAFLVFSFTFLISKILTFETIHDQLLLFFLSTAVCSWIGGMGWGIATTAASILYLDYAVLPPVGWALTREGISQLAFFLIGAILLSALMDLRRRSERRLAESEHRLELSQQSGRLCSFDCDVRADTLLFHGETKAVYGVSREQMSTTYQAWLDRIHPEDASRIKDELRTAIEARAPFAGEFRTVWPDRTIHWTSVRAQSYADPDRDTFHLIGVHMDITDRKSAEQKLLLQSEELARSNENLEQFAHIASHDLQEPLNKIMAFGDLLKREWDGQNEKGTLYLDRVTDAARRMQTLIRSLLDYARIGHGPMPLTEVDPAALLEQVLADLQPRIAEANAAVSVDALPRFRANSLQVQRLFQNLISNSLKFARKDVPVHVTVRGKAGDGVAEITVEDNGIGFEDQYARRIFEPFERLHSASRYQGSGIGLAICKKIVEAHGGSIVARGVPNQGATFVIRLPMN